LSSRGTTHKKFKERTTLKKDFSILKKKSRGMSRHEALSMPMWRTSRHLQIPGRKEVCAESAIMEGKPQGFPLSKF